VSADELATSYDRVALDYERSRPGYPAAAVDVLALPPAATVVDPSAPAAW